LLVISLCNNLEHEWLHVHCHCSDHHKEISPWVSISSVRSHTATGTSPSFCSQPHLMWAFWCSTMPNCFVWWCVHWENSLWIIFLWQPSHNTDIQWFVIVFHLLCVSWMWN
jgi:hypothetical protein